MSTLVRQSGQKLRKIQSSSAINLHKSQLKLPSRYAQINKSDKTGLQEILSSIQVKARMKSEERQQNSPNKNKKPKETFLPDIKAKIIQESSTFKTRPLKRQQNDKVRFHQIFLNHRQQALNKVQKIRKAKQSAKTITKQYQKLLKFQQGEPLDEINVKSLTKFTQQNYQQVIQFLEQENSFSVHKNKNQRNFYDCQIPVQVPTLQSAPTMISGMKSNNNPSLPPNYKNYKDLNFNELLVRAKAGMNSQDIQKQAHLSFFLGQICSEKRRNKEALKFFKRFLGFAKMMEDKVGMSVGANKVGISYYNCNDIEKSISFHKQNLKLSDHDHCFIGFYNIGICYRKLNKPQTALQYFESALSWAEERKQQQSQCIALGQIAATYQSMEYYQQAIQKFQQSLAICDKINKQSLKLNNLLEILRIASVFKLKSTSQLLSIAQQAFHCSQNLGQIFNLDLFRVNIGILKGSAQLSQQKDFSKEVQQIQEINQ